MNLRDQWQALGRKPAVRTALFLLGCLLLISTPFVGVIPGPGGVIVFGAGAALALKYSDWAKRQYARFKRKHPSKGAWADWSLRRRSFRRREKMRKERERQEMLAALRARELERLHRQDGKAALVLMRAEDEAVQYAIECRFESESPEPYWAVVAFSACYPDIELARSDGLRDLERA